MKNDDSQKGLGNDGSGKSDGEQGREGAGEVIAREAAEGNRAGRGAGAVGRED